VRASPIDGRGAFALRPIRKGRRIVEYTGERISQEEADERYDNDPPDDNHTYLFTVDKRTVIDATQSGSDARFINHSCAPNCESVLEGKRVFIEATRTIHPGEELTYDYRLEASGGRRKEWERRYACRCGTERCRGTLMAPLPRKRAGAGARRRPGASRRVARR
jgi:SET domain-containing protein